MVAQQQEGMVRSVTFIVKQVLGEENAHATLFCRALAELQEVNIELYGCIHRNSSRVV